MPTASLGLNARLYYLDPTETRGTWGVLNEDNGTVEGEGPGLGILYEIINTKDVKYTIDKGVADVSVRGNNGWAAKQGTLKDASVDVTVVYDPATAGVPELTGALLNGTPIALAILSGDVETEGTRGLWADFEVSKKDKDEPLTEGQAATFTLSPSGQSALPPEWVQVVLP